MRTVGTFAHAGSTLAVLWAVSPDLNRILSSSLWRSLRFDLDLLGVNQAPSQLELEFLNQFDRGSDAEEDLIQLSNLIFRFQGSRPTPSVLPLLISRPSRLCPALWPVANRGCKGFIATGYTDV